MQLKKLVVLGVGKCEAISFTLKYLDFPPTVLSENRILVTLLNFIKTRMTKMMFVTAKSGHYQVGIPENLKMYHASKNVLQANSDLLFWWLHCIIFFFQESFRSSPCVSIVKEESWELIQEDIKRQVCLKQCIQPDTHHGAMDVQHNTREVIHCTVSTPTPPLSPHSKNIQPLPYKPCCSLSFVEHDKQHITKDIWEP